MKSFFISLRSMAWAFVLSLALVNSAWAQKPDDDTLITTKFRVMVWTEGQPNGLRYAQAGEIIKIEGLGSTYRSAFYEYSGPSTIRFYALDAADLPDEERIVAQPIASVVIPQGVKYPLILLVSGANGGPPYRSLVFDDDPVAFPFKSYLFVSFSSRNVATSMGSESFVLSPGKTHLVTSESKNLNLRMAIKLEESSQTRVIKDDFYPNWPGYRTVFFLVDTIRDARPHIQVRSLNEPQSTWDAAINPPKE